MLFLMACTQGGPWTDTATGDVAFELDVQRVEFEDTVVGQTTTIPARLTHVGERASQASWSSGMSSFPGWGTTPVLEPGESIDLMLAFQPQSGGEHVGSMVVTWGDGWSFAGDTAASLTGYALAPDPVVTPTEVHLEAVVGCTASTPITVENLGEAPMVVSRFEVQGSTRLTLAQLTGTVEPGDHVTSDLVFAPTDGSNITATVFLRIDQTDHAIPVTAKGLAGEDCDEP